MFIVKIGVLSLVAVCLSCCSGRTGGASGTFVCCAMQVEGGYGYVVLHQPYIPAMGSKVAFATAEDALKVGELVCRKLDEKKSPGISKDEITVLGVLK